MQVLRMVLLFAVLALLAGTGPAMGQEKPADSGDDSSRRTDESEEAYRRRMELEGARDSETYSDTSYSSQVEQEKIDKLPPESQENIRDQITDIIIESDGWEPGDVLEDYPYEPTEAAKGDPALREQEEEAWAEQVDKYHEREAAAFGAMRPPMPGDPGQPGSPGFQGSDQQAGGQPGGQSGQQGQQGEQESERTAGGFNPGQSGRSSSDDEISTAGVSESALDFLRGKRGQTAPPPGGGTQPQGASGVPGAGQEPTGQSTPSLAGGDKQSEPEQPPASQPQDSTERAPAGSIPIEQLDQLQGLAGQSEPGSTSPDQPPSPAEPAPEQLAQNADLSENEQAAQDESREQLTQSEAESAEQSSEQQQPANPELDLNTAGIIAIRDLDKLEGVEENETVSDDPP